MKPQLIVIFHFHFWLNYIVLFCYREKVTIPSDKPYIYLKGAGKRHTVIVWNGHGSIDTSPTFDSQADHIVAKGIKFVVR